MLVGRLPEREHHSPFGPAPLQRLHPYYELFCPCALHRYSEPCGDHPLGSLPSHQSDRFPRSAYEPDPDSRRLRAGCRKGRASGLRPCLSRSDHRPRFRHQLYAFGSSSTVRFRSSLWTLPDGIMSRLFRDAHHHRSLRQQLAVVWHQLLIVGAEGPTLISHIAPHLHRCRCVPDTRESQNLLTTMWATSASVAMPPSIGRSGAGACTTVPSQARHP